MVVKGIIPVLGEEDEGLEGGEGGEEGWEAGEEVLYIPRSLGRTNTGGGVGWTYVRNRTAHGV